MNLHAKLKLSLKLRLLNYHVVAFFFFPLYLILVKASFYLFNELVELLPKCKNFSNLKLQEAAMIAASSRNGMKFFFTHDSI